MKNGWMDETSLIDKQTRIIAITVLQKTATSRVRAEKKKHLLLVS